VLTAGTGVAVLDATLDESDDARFFATLRASELSRVDRSGQTYLDWTGGALHPASLVRRHAELLEHTVLGNPHSDSLASRASTQVVARAREALLRFLDADPDVYEVCFTANASGALRLIGEAYPFTRRSHLLLAADNHNSVNGIRTYAHAAAATVHVMRLDADLRLDGGDAALGSRRADDPSLVAFPAQSNFSGVRHPLALVDRAHELGFDVLLDAAAFLPTASLSLRAVPADFVVLSLYKIVGYPSGVGALVARRDALARLRRPSFSGGTVDAVAAWHDVHLLKEGGEAFEDGTVNFVGLAAVPAALEFITNVGVARISRRVQLLARQLTDGLSGLRHRNGAPLVRLYGARGEDRGATIAFNVLDPAGQVIPYWRVEERARHARVSIRGGCFCNPGAAERALDIDSRDLAACLRAWRDRGVALSHAGLAECLGRPVGALRMSLGYGSDEGDVRRGIGTMEETGALEKR
jgi:selenocysteine lyase/cysteine desulfurase